MSAFVMTATQVCKAKKHDYWTHQYNYKLQNQPISPRSSLGLEGPIFNRFGDGPKKQMVSMDLRPLNRKVAESGLKTGGCAKKGPIERIQRQNLQKVLINKGLMV